MSDKTPELKQALELALTLSPLDKVLLVEQLMVTLEDDLRPTTKPTTKPRKKSLNARFMAYGQTFAFRPKT